MTMFQALGHKRGIARVLECFACSAAAKGQPARSLRLAGAAAALRKTVGAALTPSEQAKLERGLEPARQTLTNSTAATVWFEGWTVPLEKAIEEVLLPHSTARLDPAHFSRRSLRSCRVDQSADGGDAIRREASPSRVFPDRRLVWSEVHAIELVSGDVAMQPLNRRTHSIENIHRLLRDFAHLGIG